MIIQEIPNRSLPANIKDHDTYNLLRRMTGVDLWFLNPRISKQTCSQTGALAVEISA